MTQKRVERGILMKMKKIVSIALSAVLLLGIAAATAFAAESTPSKTGSDADVGNVEFSISGTGDGLVVEVGVTDASKAEEAAFQKAGSVAGYYGKAVAETAAKLLNTTTDNLTANGIKQLTIKGYKDTMGSVTIRMPFAALPKAGTQVAVAMKIVTADGNVVTAAVPGKVVENKGVRKVEFTLDSTTVKNVQAGTAYVSVVTAK